VGVLTSDAPAAFRAGIQNRSRIFKDLSVVLVLLVLGDGVLTEYIIGCTLGQEANPFVSRFMETGSLIWLKALGALIAALMLWDISRRQPRVALVACCICVAIYTLILYWNLGVMWFSAF
jgi:hypothetical protein